MMIPELMSDRDPKQVRAWLVHLCAVAVPLLRSVAPELLPVLSVATGSNQGAAVRTEHLRDRGGGIRTRRFPPAEHLADMAGRVSSPRCNLSDAQGTRSPQPPK